MRIRNLALAFVLSAGIAGLTRAQTESERTQPPGESGTAKAEKGFVTSNKIIGAKIKNAAGEELAELVDLVMDNKGKIQFAIAAKGGVLGVGEKRLAIPVQAIECKCTTTDGEKQCHGVLEMTAEKLDQAPKLESGEYAELADPEWCKTNCEFYGVEPPKSEAMPTLISAAKVNNTAVQGTGEQRVGQLDAFIINLEKGMAEFCVLGVGGALGVGEKYTAVPFQSLNFNKRADGALLVSVNATKETVAAAPKVTPTEYPELDQESFRNRIKENFPKAGT